MSELDLLSRYQRAAELMPERLAALTRNRAIAPQWTGQGDTFWYARETNTEPAGTEYVVVDPDARTRTVVTTIEDLHLAESPAPLRPGLLASPDAKGGVFRKEDDLWWLDADGSERPLTTDGVPSFGWGETYENNMMNVPFKRMGVVLPPLGTTFSPSGRFLVTMRVDQRSMGVRTMVEHVSPSGEARPLTHQIRVQLEDEPGELAVELRIIDLSTGSSAGVDPALGLGHSLMTNGSREAHWSGDESAVYFLQHETGGSRVAIVEVDTATGASRERVRFDEAPLYEPNQYLYSLPLWHVLASGQEAILFSQRDGWGHLYLYDLTNGELKNRITSGELVVRDLLRVDESRREVTFIAGSAEGRHNPYWRKVYRASLDGSRQTLLTPEPADHELSNPQPEFFHLVFGQGKPQQTSISPSGRYFIDKQSTISTPPVILLRDADNAGAVVLELECTDVTRLEAAGFVSPHEFCVKADDGVTDLWGVIAMPSNPVDPQRIPVIEYIYAGFQMSTQPPGYLGGAWLPMYNELGFATVIMDTRGTPGRHRDFRQWTHLHGHTTRGLEDHPHAIKQLKQSYPALDLDRVGVIGHSFGGYNTARCMLMFPDFYKAGVSSAGVHQSSRVSKGGWDWFMGAQPDRSSREYDEIGNLHLADQLAGDLLLIANEIDENATIDHTYALMDALIKAGKRFDLKILPGFNHYQTGPYFHMVCWDHFVRSLHGLDVPTGFVPAAAAVAPGA